MKKIKTTKNKAKAIMMTAIMTILMAVPAYADTESEVNDV